MQTKIENEQEFADTIDQLGHAQAEIARQKSDADILRQMLEAYAVQNGIREHATTLYQFEMAKGKSSLRRGKDVKESDVVLTLKRSEIGKDYLVYTYDAEALKRDFGGNAQGREHLAALGLFLTRPEAHAKVKPL